MLEDDAPENMVCATVNAPHAALSTTLLAFLAAHRPEKELTLVFQAPDGQIRNRWIGMIPAGPGDIDLTSRGESGFTATACALAWTKLLREQGPAMQADGIEIAPTRPGAHRPA